MTKLNIIESLALDAEAAFVWIVIVGAALGIASSAATAYVLGDMRNDWRKDYLYKPVLSYVLNLVLVFSRVVYLYSINIVLGENVGNLKCVLQAVFQQFFDSYVWIMLVAMVWSTTTDAITVMVEYPSADVNQTHLEQLLRLSTGGALGFTLDTELLREGIIAPTKPRESSSGSEVEDEDELERMSDHEKTSDTARSGSLSRGNSARSLSRAGTMRSGTARSDSFSSEAGSGRLHGGGLLRGGADRHLKAQPRTHAYAQVHTRALLSLSASPLGMMLPGLDLG